MTRLTKAQERVLGILADARRSSDGTPLSSPEISRIAGKRFDDWAYGKLVSLEKRGFVERLGVTFSGGRCWAPTEAGRSALARANWGGNDA